MVAAPENLTTAVTLRIQAFLDVYLRRVLGAGALMWRNLALKARST